MKIGVSATASNCQPSIARVGRPHDGHLVDGTPYQTTSAIGTASGRLKQKQRLREEQPRGW
jgi:hypothetical protein